MPQKEHCALVLWSVTAAFVVGVKPCVVRSLLRDRTIHTPPCYTDYCSETELEKREEARHDGESATTGPAEAGCSSYLE